MISSYLEDDALPTTEIEELRSILTKMSQKGGNNISKVVSKISRPTKGRLLCYSIFGGNFG